MTDTPTVTKKDRVINIVRELQKRTTENGCTEAEALVAAAKVSKLMEEYQLSISDINEIKDDVYGALKKQYGNGSLRRRAWHETKKAWCAIASFTDTQCWVSGTDLTFFGSKTDCEIAFFLCDLIKNTSEVEWKAYKSSADATLTNRTGRASFMAGFSSRISQRLHELKKQRKDALNQNVNSKALVVVKDQVVAEKFALYKKTNNLRLQASYSHSGRYDGETYGAGRRAGEKVNISSGISGSSSQLKIAA